MLTAIVFKILVRKVQNETMKLLTGETIHLQKLTSLVTFGIKPA